jgi:hypothetical protein
VRPGNLGGVLVAIEQRSTDETAHRCIKFSDQPDGPLCCEAILISIARQPLGHVRVGGQRRGLFCVVSGSRATGGVAQSLVEIVLAALLAPACRDHPWLASGIDPDCPAPSLGFHLEQYGCIDRADALTTPARFGELLVGFAQQGVVEFVEWVIDRRDLQTEVIGEAAQCGANRHLRLADTAELGKPLGG